MELRQNISVTQINVKGFNTPIKRQIFPLDLKKQRSTMLNTQ